jgi:hypothetical protein
MSEPKSIEEVPSWVIVNALKCPIEAQISIVAKLLQHLDGDQRNKALSMSGVSGSVCDACHGFDARAGRLGIGHLGCHKCGK